MTTNNKTYIQPTITRLIITVPNNILGNSVTQDTHTAPEEDDVTLGAKEFKGEWDEAYNAWNE